MQQAHHDIHFLAREIDDWLPKGIQSMINGCYDPRPLKRYYFIDEIVNQLHISEGLALRGPLSQFFSGIFLKKLDDAFLTSTQVYYLMNRSQELVRSYLHHFVIWWSTTVDIWRYEEILDSFIRACFDIKPAAIAAGLFRAPSYITEHLL